MADRITTAEVAHVAKLAHLRLGADELETITGQLAAVLAHFADIEALDTSGVEPTAHPLPITNVLRDDVARPGLDRAEVLAMAPDVSSDRFRVPSILGATPTPSEGETR